MRCSHCGYIDNRPGIYYCPQCGGSFGRGVGRLPASTFTSQSTQLAVQSGPGPAVLAVRQAYDVSSQPAAIQHIRLERYRATEALYRDMPLWESVFKHLAALGALNYAKGFLPKQDEIRMQAFVKYHEQEIEIELARRRAEQTDLILQEQIFRKTFILTEILGQIEKAVSSPQLAGLPDESKAELIARLYELAEKWVFTNSTLHPPTATPPRLPNSGITVIDADEF